MKKLQEVVQVFFKSRVQRDIEDFKAMQDAALRIAKPEESSDQQSVSTDDPSTGQHAPKLDDEAIDRIIKGLTNGANEHQQSVVSADATWEGKLRTKGSARIDGEISGEVEAGETVLIARGARVRANIHARQVIIVGDMEGQITCREQLVVEQSGRLGGKVSTKTLVIQEGAIVHSQIQMLRDNELVQARAKGTITLRRQDPTALGAIQVSQRLDEGQVRESGPQSVEQGKEE